MRLERIDFDEQSGSRNFGHLYGSIDAIEVDNCELSTLSDRSLASGIRGIWLHSISITRANDLTERAIR